MQKRILGLCAATLFVLWGCGTKAPPPAKPTPPAPVTPPPPAPVAPPPAAPVAPQAKIANARNLEDFKKEIATLILQANPDLTFNGVVPPMLRSVTIVKLTFTRQGLAQYSILRSAGLNDFDQVVLQSLRNAQPLPAPRSELLQGKAELEYTETWLMRQDRKFQIRSVSAPQAYGSK
ncbi:TonB C-terminal domain-containing protein [Parvibium lacunae]|uniref:Lipoprotein n=1 Tax=Parvibium lacunae TaxID=1888893 RepID=A0A368L1Q1_9BURK|nr:TonB C-terminal domain-containing protein [Parvibium lacunae]RCS57032.1 hypothetical protein DU000_09500 [Parvibium lacunae]